MSNTEETPDVTPQATNEAEAEEEEKKAAPLKRRFTLEAEAILGEEIEKMVAIADKSKLMPANVINEENSSGMSSSNSRISSHRTNPNEI